MLTERTPRVVSAVKLHRAAHRRRVGLFLAEGENSVSAAVATGRAHEIFVAESARDRFSDTTAAAVTAGVPVYVVTDRAAQRLSDTVTAPGIVAVCVPVDVPFADAVPDGATLVAVPVAVGEPGNAGTIVRVADALGADAVVFAGDTVDPHNGKCVRSSAGSLFHVPVARERDVDRVLADLRRRGIAILATAADGEVDLDDADTLLARPTAWLFGSEAHGLPADVVAAADHRVRIPIRGRAESLNLATAAAICLHASSRVQHRARRDASPAEGKPTPPIT